MDERFFLRCPRLEHKAIPATRCMKTKCKWLVVAKDEKRPRCDLFDRMCGKEKK